MSALVPTGDGGGGPLVPAGTTLADLVPRFLQWFRFVRRRSEHTVRNYELDLQSFVAFCERAGLTEPDAVSFRHVELYLGVLQAERGVKPRTANRHVFALRAFWKWMRREGVTTTNPAEDTFLLPEHKGLPERLEIPEQEHVLDVLSADRSLIGRRDHALVATGLLTGVRCQELATLEVGDVDLAGARLVIRHGKGDKAREIPIIPRLHAILSAYLTEVRPALVGRPDGWLRRFGEIWHLEHSASARRGRARTRSLQTRDRAEAERRQREEYPPPPDPGWLFVQAVTQGGGRRRTGLPLHGRSLWHLLHRVVAPLVGRPVYPHMLRHSFASRLREHGAPIELISEAMGHTRLSTTLIYAKITTTKRRDDLARYLEGEETA